MSVKDEVYHALRDVQGEYVSGQALSERLHVTRNAVWKAVAALRRDGAQIEAATNRGYRLLLDPGRFTAEDIAHLAGHALLPELYDKLPSTNTELKNRACLGAPEYTVLAACAQSAGRGRSGRSFYSPPDCGVYFSILLRPKCTPEQLFSVTPAAAVAAAQALEALCGRETQIKWVNDVYIDGKKCVGILTEIGTDLESGTLDYLVCGFGVNLYPPPDGYPAPLAGIAGSVFPEKPGADLRAAVAADILDRFLDALEMPTRALLAIYREKSLLTGKQVTVSRGAHRIPAQVLGIGDDFSLHIRRADCISETLRAGEVHIRL